VPKDSHSLYNPLAFVDSGWRNRSLILRLTARKIEARYRGSVLGVLWGLLNPLMMLGLYTFVFSVVFRARWAASGRNEVALLIFAGLLLYTVFAKCVNEAPSLVVNHRTYIKQVVFPAEILVWVIVLTALFDFAIGFGGLGAFWVAGLGVPPATWLLLPLMLMPVVLLALGTTWLLSSLGVFLRDIEQVVGTFTTALLFLSPIFYPASRVPEELRSLYEWNPFALLVEMFREAVFSGFPPDWARWAVVAGVSWLTAWLGYAWFMTTKRSFADVL